MSLQKHSKEELQKYTEFKARLESFREANNDQKELLDCLKYHDEQCVLLLDSSQLNHRSDCLFAGILNLLNLLESIDFTGLKRFKIEIRNFSGDIDLELINRIQISLNSLKNISVLWITEENLESVKWNPYTFLLFTTHEISSKVQRYNYELFQHSDLKIKLSQEIQKEKLKYLFEIYSELAVEGDCNFGLYSIIDHVVELAKKLRTRTDKSDNQLQKMNSSTNDRSRPKKITIDVFKKNCSYFEEQLQNLTGLLKFFDLDYSRISSVYLRLFTKQANKIEEISTTYADQTFDFNEFQNLRLTNKTILYLSDFLLDKQLYLFQILMKCVKGLEVLFLKDSTGAYQELPKIIEEIQGGCIAGEYVQFQRLTVKNVDRRIFDEIFKIVEQLPSLKRFWSLFVKFNQIPKLPEYYDRVFALLSRLRFYFAGQIVFSRTRLTLTLGREEFENYCEIIPETIKQINKAIKFDFSFHDLPNTPGVMRKVIPMLKNIISNPMVAECVMHNAKWVDSIQQVLNERMSLYNQMSAYKLLIDQYMWIDSQRVNYDLYESI